MDETEELDVDLGESDEEEIQITPAELINMIEEMWINEKFAPEILPQKIDIVNCTLEQLSAMEENLETLDSKDFQKNLHKMEMDRLRFMITSYLRIRIQKIEDFVVAILKQEEDRAQNNLETYLTADELSYAKSYKESLEQHFESVLKFLPILPPDDWKTSPKAPNMHSYVFLRSKDEIQGVVINNTTEDNGDLMDFKNGTQIIMPYINVANLVKEGRVCLI